MKELIILVSSISVMCLFLHEMDACRLGEWRMFKFLSGFKEAIQYRIFLYAHVPLSLLLFYYMWTVVTFGSIGLFIVVNCLLIFHGLLHLIATRWKTNVFHSVDSFIFVSGATLLGALNLCLIGFYA